MIKSVNSKVLMCAVIVAVSAAFVFSQEQVNTEEVGKENPFKPESSPIRTFNKKITQMISPDEYSPELFVQTVVLKFLQAKNLMDALENILSEHGTITVDAKSNSLIICDTRQHLDKILQEIKNADKTPKQIVIEAVILDVQLEDDTEIGINWDIMSDKFYDVSYRQKLGSRLNSTIEDSTTIGNATAFNTTGTVDGGYFALISGTIRNTVHLLQERKNVEILASPRVLVTSGEEAYIETIEEIPYREQTDTSGGGQLATTEFKEVGVKLRVTALLTDDDYIVVTVEPEQSVNTGRFGTTSEVPIIDTRKAKSTLLLRDGEIVIMGGLRKKEITDQVSKVPLLGDLPLIGFLFRNTQKVVKNSELIVFLSPHIYQDESLTKDEMKKFNELKDRPLLDINSVKIN